MPPIQAAVGLPWRERTVDGTFEPLLEAVEDPHAAPSDADGTPDGGRYGHSMLVGGASEPNESRSG